MSIIKACAIIGLIMIAGLIAFFIGLYGWGYWNDNWSGYNASLYVSDGICNIGVFPLHGDIYTYHETEEYKSVTPGDVRQFLATAESDEYVAGILFEVDSLGGYPAASAEIARMIKNSFLPNVALIGDYGTSGGYLAASAADWIIASPFADVGGIGVTMSYLSNVQQNENEGIEYVPLASAPFKDYGSPDKELTQEERALLERDLSIYHDEFVKAVAANRNLNTEEVRALADGSSMPAPLAVEHKLIDEVGSRDQARTFFAQMLGVGEDEVIFCPDYVPYY